MEADDHRTDRSLALRAATGDNGAFRDLVARIHPRVHRWALGASGDPAEADEATQDVLIKVYRNLGSYRGDARFSTWLYRVTRNVLIDRARSRDAGGESVPLELVDRDATDDPAPVRGLYAAAVAELVHCFFRELPDRQREVFDLADLQGYTSPEIAEMLDIAPSSVRVSLMKARRTVRGRILERHPELLEGYTP